MSDEVHADIIGRSARSQANSKPKGKGIPRASADTVCCYCMTHVRLKSFFCRALIMIPQGTGAPCHGQEGLGSLMESGRSPQVLVREALEYIAGQGELWLPGSR